MSDMKVDTSGRLTIIELTAEIVSAFVSTNAIGKNELGELIASTHAALGKIAAGDVAAAEPEPLVPPVPIRKSITDDYLISLEDGRQYKTLRRHLTGRGLTPEGYRAKWGLPASYPMVAPAYAKRRSELAKSNGLGRKSEAPAAPAPTRGRRKSA